MFRFCSGSVDDPGSEDFPVQMMVLIQMMILVQMIIRDLMMIRIRWGSRIRWWSESNDDLDLIMIRISDVLRSADDPGSDDDLVLNQYPVQMMVWIRWRSGWDDIPDQWIQNTENSFTQKFSTLFFYLNFLWCRIMLFNSVFAFSWFCC